MTAPSILMRGATAQGMGTGVTNPILKLSADGSLPGIPTATGPQTSANSISVTPATDLGAESVIQSSDYPAGATPTNASSGSVANATAAATLAAVVGKVTYIAGFSVTGSGATVGSVVSVTVTGLVGGTATFVMTATAGALLMNQGLNMAFNPPIPALAANTAIVVSCPALGAGNTANATNAWGYQL